MKKSLATAMAALTFGAAVAATAAPAEARDHGYDGYDGYHRHRGNSTGTAVVAGIAGLALGAALSSNSGRRNDGYYSRSYAYSQPYYGDSYYAPRGYYAYERPYRTCESSRWVWDPYIEEQVLIRSRYAC